MFGLEKEIVVFDTEYTSWEGALERNWSGLNEHKEIVQIGAVIVDTDSLEEKDSLLLYVKPVKNPILSDFLVQLTGIQQKVVDKEGLTYKEALVRFSTWSRNLPLYCWGWDVEIMQENAELLGLPFPFILSNDPDIRKVFSKKGIEAEKYHSGTIPKAFGEEPPPHAHDALNDARSIVQGFRALARRKS